MRNDDIYEFVRRKEKHQVSTCRLHNAYSISRKILN